LDDSPALSTSQRCSWGRVIRYYSTATRTVLLKPVRASIFVPQLATLTGASLVRVAAPYRYYPYRKDLTKK